MKNTENNRQDYPDMKFSMTPEIMQERIQQHTIPKLRRIREENGYTQENMAKMLDRTRQWIGQIEKGKVKSLPSEILYLYCYYCHADMDWLAKDALSRPGDDDVEDEPYIQLTFRLKNVPETLRQSICKLIGDICQFCKSVNIPVNVSEHIRPNGSDDADSSDSDWSDS